MLEATQRAPQAGTRSLQPAQANKDKNNGTFPIFI